MTRPQPNAARPWLLRWLLVVLTLAGLGIWQGGHCADDMSVELTATSAHAVAGVNTGNTAVDGLALASSAIAEQAHRDVPPPARQGGSDTTADECRVLPATTTAGTTAAGGLTPAGPGFRTLAPAPRPQPVKQRLLPAVALVALGVSRT